MSRNSDRVAQGKSIRGIAISTGKADSMKLEVTELGPIKRVLKIEVPLEEVDREFAAAYAELNRKVHIPGFRPGKVPLVLLEKRFAKAVEEDLVRKLIPAYYDRAIRQAGIIPVLVEVPPFDRIKIKRNAAFSFTAIVEIKPKIELLDYKPPNPISLKPDKRAIGEEEIAHALNVLREQHAQLHPAPSETALSEGDFAILDIEGFLDLAPLDGAKKEGQLHRVGSKAPLLGLEVDAHLIGKKGGEIVEIAQPYPLSHPDQRLAGKTVVFRVTVKGIGQKKLPALDDEFAKDCGPYNSLAELKGKLRSQLEATLKEDIEDSYKDAVLKRLLESHHFEVPAALVERELASMVRHQFEHMIREERKTTRLEDPARRQEEIKRLREGLRPEAARRVKAGLLLEAIAEQERIVVDKEDIEAEIQRLASEAKASVQEVRRVVEAGGEDSLAELQGRILADKALDFVYRHAIIQG